MMQTSTTQVLKLVCGCNVDNGKGKMSGGEWGDVYGIVQHVT
jgi:hypothetical protein